MITILYILIGVLILSVVSLITYIIIDHNNYKNNYNKRYIEKIKQNVARSLVNPYKEK